MSPHLNPLATQAQEYPFARLVEIRQRREREGRKVLDFSVGDPREPTPAFLREVLKRSIPEVSSYPTVKGSRELRESIAGYLLRRFRLRVDPECHILPVNGTKEGIFTSQLALIDPKSTRRTVITFEPSYPVYARGAEYAGGIVHPIALRAEDMFRPDAATVPAELLRRTQIVWLNYPHNPTGAEAAPEIFERFATLAREHDFVLCSDECYSDLFFDRPPPSVLVPELAPDFKNLLAFHSCSKRSAMTGYRSGFIAGDPGLLEVLARFRPSVGVATPSFVQAMATAAWNDDAHAVEMAARYRRRRDIFLDLFHRKGWRHDGGNATFFLWWRVPEGFGHSARFAERLLDLDILVAPGSFIGVGGESHVRLALIATEDECAEAVRRLEHL